MTQPTDNAEQPYVTVEIYDQAYHLSGPDPDQVRRLAALVDARMRAVASRGRTADSLRVAVLAALNLADELSRAEDSLRAAEGSSGSEGSSSSEGLSSSESSASLRADLQIRAANLRGLLDTVLEEDAPASS